MNKLPGWHETVAIIESVCGGTHDRGTGKTVTLCVR